MIRKRRPITDKRLAKYRTEREPEMRKVIEKLDAKKNK